VRDCQTTLSLAVMSCYMRRAQWT